MTPADGHVGLKDGRPLAGVRVLEFGHFVAGPFAGTLLSDLGADVVKIEPLTGDALRGENAAPFMSANRGKRAIALDIKADGGAGIVEAATQWADVVTHNFRPGVDKRLGIDAATLRARKPGIVVVQSTAYGPDGPKAALPGFDTLLQGFAGHFVQAGGDETRPLAYRFSHVDYASGMMGALGVVSALYAGRRGGTVPSVNVSLMNTAVYMLSQLVREPDGQFHGLPTLSADRTGFSPAESLYRAADGWLAVAALGEPAGRRLAEALDLSRVAELPVSQWGESEKQEIGEAISRQTVQAAVGSLRESGVWAEPVQTEPVPALMSDEGMVAAGTAFVAGPADGAVQRSQPGRIASFRRLSNQLTAADAHVPELGEHTREFLAELGYGPADIDDLVARGVVM
jgi:crotonobetainyl-CoA:carnitine CoA-transferase CaiB-like acyl-CoA transferase